MEKEGENVQRILSLCMNENYFTFKGTENLVTIRYESINSVHRVNLRRKGSYAKKLLRYVDKLFAIVQKEKIANICRELTRYTQKFNSP